MKYNKKMESLGQEVANDKIDAEIEDALKVNEADELVEMKDKYLRAMAELENVRRRAATDMESALRSRAIAVADEFLPLVDAIDAAVVLTPDDEGISTLKKAADSALARIGIVRIAAVGEVLNPVFHNAISSETSDAPANTIIKELQTGYMFGGNVLRTSIVIVSK